MNEDEKPRENLKEQMFKHIINTKAYLIALNSQYITESEKEKLFELCFSEVEHLRYWVETVSTKDNYDRRRT